ncbi:eukaryotic translation initiation factor 3 subunit J-A-like [Adelges cooleyi]|uniref:eukaryotic translation initiation factor 3 subunit J-A-like n=1 Tax=Adelges cooleyi TaxID=133065 RepID=UPI002180871A|nr:eukaryotic translation initiation factor 3 subunit J-A-like [Adelges cooleyi]
MADVVAEVKETITTPEKKVADSPAKEKKIQDSPVKNVESPAKENSTPENGSNKDDDVKENGSVPEVEEKEQNGDNKEDDVDSCQKACKRKSNASELVVEAEEASEKKAKLDDTEEDPATAEPESAEA